MTLGARPQHYLHLVHSRPSGGRVVTYPRILESRYVPIGDPNDHFALIFRTIRHECMCRKGPVGQIGAFVVDTLTSSIHVVPLVTSAPSRSAMSGPPRRLSACDRIERMTAASSGYCPPACLVFHGMKAVPILIIPGRRFLRHARSASGAVACVRSGRPSRASNRRV